VTLLIVDVETAQHKLEQLIELAKSDEEVLVQDGNAIVRLEPIFGGMEPEAR